MAQKGFIDYNDLIKPINRTSILNALDILKLKDSNLSVVEKKELNFYLQEYTRPSKEQISLFKKTKIKDGEQVLLLLMILNFILTRY